MRFRLWDPDQRARSEHALLPACSVSESQGDGPCRHACLLCITTVAAPESVSAKAVPDLLVPLSAWCRPTLRERGWLGDGCILRQTREANIARRHGGLPNMEEDAAKAWRKEPSPSFTALNHERAFEP